MKNLTNVLGLLVLGMSMTMCTPKTDTLTASTPEEAINKLIAGNERFVNESSIYPRTDIDRAEETAPHQNPFAAVVGCSDSRVPVELIFDQGIGDIFVIRTAGNNVNSDMVMGSVDYAIEHLGVKVLLVMGHGSCGGVTGAIAEHEEEHGNIGKLLGTIRQDITQYIGKPESLDAAIKEHAHIQVERILSYPHVAEKVKKGELLVKRAYYDIQTGKVTID
ncbi:MAG: carbonic anhydrase [Bacteroidaceae bacterium]|nr:carbonic anhydrase [Bacteroidaceae bacterium]